MSNATTHLLVDSAGTDIVVETRRGEGVPLVIVPGVMADADTWRPVVDHIALPNPVATVNRRGRKPSGPLGQGYSVSTEIADLHRVIEALGGDVHLFGWSYGALIALEAAAQRGGIRSLAAYEPVAGPFGVDAVPLLRDAIAVGDLDRAVELVNTAVSGFSADHVAELRRTPAWEVLRPLAEPLADELTAINDHLTAWRAYREFSVPVTLLLGELNDGVPPYGTAFDTFAAALPGAEIVKIASEGHLAHVGAPARLGRHITDIVGRHSNT